MILDRRESPRYSVSQHSFVQVTENDSTRDFSVELVDLSLKSARVSCTAQIPCSPGLSLEIKDPARVTPPMRLSARIDHIRKKNHFQDYILVFDRLNDDENTHLRCLLEQLPPISDRRSEPETSFTISYSDKSERRLTKPIFLKCLRFNRAEKLLANRQFFYFRELQSGSMNRVKIKGREMINFSSNNYLGLSTHPEIKEAARKAIEKYGVGTGGSRLLSGTMDLHNELERKIARFKEEEDCFVYSSGYHANVGIISTILTKKENVTIDAKNHASIIDGCYLSGANLSVYQHNDMNSLERKLKKIGMGKSTLIISDGVFSMDGDIVKLDQMAELAKKYNAAIMLDDAHALGVLGKNGKGTSDYYHMQGIVDLTMGTLSKSIGALGGFIAGKKKLVHFLKCNSRSFIFTTSLPPAILAAALKAFDIIEKEPQWIARLWRNIHFARKELTESGFDIGLSQTAIIPIIIGDESLTYRITDFLEKNGIFISPVAYPAVKRRESRLRLSLMATHDEEDLSILINTLKQARKIFRWPPPVAPGYRSLECKGQ